MVFDDGAESSGVPLKSAPDSKNSKKEHLCLLVWDCQRMKHQEQWRWTECHGAVLCGIYEEIVGLCRPCMLSLTFGAFEVDLVCGATE